MLTAPARSALSRARLLTVVWLLSAVLSVVLVPLTGVAREPSVLLRTTGLVGVGALFCAQLLVIWSAVSPWVRAGGIVKTCGWACHATC